MTRLLISSFFSAVVSVFTVTSFTPLSIRVVTQPRAVEMEKRKKGIGCSTSAISELRVVIARATMFVTAKTVVEKKVGKYMQLAKNTQLKAELIPEEHKKTKIGVT